MRIENPPPAPERTPLGDWTDHAARFAHYALYTLRHEKSVEEVAQIIHVPVATSEGAQVLRLQMPGENIHDIRLRWH
jgi:hypothetical protein